MRHLITSAMLMVALLFGGGLVACDSSRDDGPPPSNAQRTRPRPAPVITPLTGRRFAGIWVTRWDYQSAGDIATIFENAANLGVTDVFFQVRGQADAYYESSLEPWGEELFRGMHVAQSHPGYDPLTLACTEARRRGLRIHAWVNVMPIWKGKTPPRSREHAFYQNTEWLLRDRTGAPQPLTDHYITANPMRDSFRAHVGNVVDDIISRYPVDGLHMDYIRFVSDTLPEGRVYPGDDWSVGKFRSATGLDAWKHRTAYRLHIREAITDVVREISTVVRDRRSRVIISAAVWRDPSIAKSTYLQDYATWLDHRLIDMAIPMIYTDSSSQFEMDLRASMRVRNGRKIVAGIGVYKHQDAAALVDQLMHADAVGADGVCLFGYASLFNCAAPDQDRSAEALALRAARREAIEAYLRTRLPAGG